MRANANWEFESSKFSEEKDWQALLQTVKEGLIQFWNRQWNSMARYGTVPEWKVENPFPSQNGED